MIFLFGFFGGDKSVPRCRGRGRRDGHGGTNLVDHRGAAGSLETDYGAINIHGRGIVDSPMEFCTERRRD